MTVGARVRSALALAVVVPVSLLAGCGSSDSDDGQAEAQQIVEELQSLEEGEIVIRGSSTRVYGPYTFRRGGYVLRFEHGAADESPGRLVVALESKPRATAPPYQLVVDTERPLGTAAVTMAGSVYVHVREARESYVLRFRPRG